MFCYFLNIKIYIWAECPKFEEFDCQDEFCYRVAGGRFDYKTTSVIFFCFKNFVFLQLSDTLFLFAIGIYHIFFWLLNPQGTSNEKGVPSSQFCFEYFFGTTPHWLKLFLIFWQVNWIPPIFKENKIPIFEVSF